MLMQDANYTIRISIAPIGSSMVDTILGCVPDTPALWRMVAWISGHALASIAEAFALADHLAHPFTSMTAFVFGFAIYLSDRQPEEVLSRLEIAEALPVEQRLTFITEPEILRGAALVELSAIDEGTDLIRYGLTKTRQRGSDILLAIWHYISRTRADRRDQHRAALAAVREGLEVAAATGQHAWDAELYRLGGVACWRATQETRARLTLIRHFGWLGDSKRSPMNSAPRRAWRILGRARKAVRSARTARADLRLVHRGPRYRQSEGSKDAARRARVR